MISCNLFHAWNVRYIEEEKIVHSKPVKTLMSKGKERPCKKLKRTRLQIEADLENL